MKRLISALLASLMLLGVAPLAASAEGETSLTLSDKSHLVLDTASGYVDKIDGTITVADLKANFASAITVKTGDTEKADDKFVATDDVISAGEDSLKALIYGDVDRTGKINLTDVSGTMKNIAKWETNISIDAADVDKNGAVNLQDAGKLLKSIAGFDDISLGNVRMTADNVKLPAENEDSRLNLYFVSSMVKLGQHNTTSTGKFTYKMKTARNEYETCQAILTSTADMEGLTVSITPFEHEYGEGTLSAELFYEYYYTMGVFDTVHPFDPSKNYVDDLFPEMLLPATTTFEIKAGTAQGVMVKVKTEKDAPAGMYRATLNFMNAEGKVVKSAYVYTYVWDFTLPDTPYSGSSFGMSGAEIYGYMANFDKKWYQGDEGYTHSVYYEFLLEHNLSAYQMPYKVTDERADKYMSDPRVTSFEACGENLRRAAMDDPAFVKAAYAKVMSNPEWAAKYHFYYVDEPYMSGLEFVKEDHAYLTELLGTDDFRMVVPLASNTYANKQAEIDNIDAVEYLSEYLNFWCPQSPAFEPKDENGLWSSRRMLNKYGEFQPRYEAFRERGDKMWWYICISPQPPYPNYYTIYQGYLVRMVMWQQYMYDVDGILYWATQYSWGSVFSKRDPQLKDMGDGQLLYPGEMFGYAQTPIASWRLEQISESFDEFDYMRIAEELCGREAVMKVINKVTTGLRVHTDDYTVLEACRNEIANMIVEAMAK